MIPSRCRVIGAVFQAGNGTRFVLRRFSASGGNATLETVPTNGEAPRSIEIPLDEQPILVMISSPDQDQQA